MNNVLAADYGVRSALFWDVTQRGLVIPYRRFGTKYRSHLQGSRNPRLTCRLIKMKRIMIDEHECYDGLDTQKDI